MPPNANHTYGALDIVDGSDSGSDRQEETSGAPLPFVDVPDKCSGGKSRRIVKRIALTCVLCAAALLLPAVRRRVRRGAATETIGGVRPDGGSGGGSAVATSGDGLAFSSASAVDLGIPHIDRPDETSPGKVFGEKLLTGGKTGRRKPLPTNEWYLNLLSNHAGSESTEANRAYTVPYIVDTVGPITGLRMHWPVTSASDRNVQMTYDASNALTLGAADSSKMSKDYRVDEDSGDLSLLGISLKWEGNTWLGKKTSMVSHIVRGMPYGTMQYTGVVTPAIASGNILASPPLLDNSDGEGKKLTCGTMADLGKLSSGGAETAVVNHEVELHFKESDFTWLVFFSRPVKVQCFVEKQESGAPGVVVDKRFQMNVVEVDGEDEAEGPLVVRTALANQCTTGKSVISQHCMYKPKDPAGYLKILRDSADLYPRNPTAEFALPSKNAPDESRIYFDWDVQSMGRNGGGTDSKAATVTTKAAVAVEALPLRVEDSNLRKEQNKEKDETELIMFAMPHHQEILEPVDGSRNEVTEHCALTFHGEACLVGGKRWSLVEAMGESQKFRADRPPDASAIPDLANALAKDIKYRLGDNVMRGAMDTYFSGKMLAKLGRIVLIASELKDLASVSSATTREDYDDDEGYTATVEACREESLPSDDEVEAAVDALKQGVEIWLNGTAEAIFTYDTAWGGLVNCGCDYRANNEHGHCKNSYPDCPALSDPNVNFGNGYYNDHHFHYGYMVYAAAVVAKYDPSWGKRFFDHVLFLIRDVANPSADDPLFPQFRQKDWYIGSSWASGIVSADSPHGRNQESSSEAISAYEAVALYGATMMDIWNSNGSKDAERVEAARRVRDVGQLLTTTEVKAANRYWHVWNGSNHKNSYPAQYKQPVVGMLYQTMASFQTWFSPKPYVSYGIQLIPLTPIAEERDDPQWAAELYPMYKKSCFDDKKFCQAEGWSIMLFALQAEAGQRGEAIEQALSLPAAAFTSSGGNGHSMTNTLWYIATRPEVTVNSTDTDTNNSTTVGAPPVPGEVAAMPNGDGSTADEGQL